MRITRLIHAYRFPGYRPLVKVEEQRGPPSAVLVTLRRTYQKKDRNVRTVGLARPVGTITGRNGYGIMPAGNYGFTLNLILDVSSAGSAAW